MFKHRNNIQPFSEACGHLDLPGCRQTVGANAFLTSATINHKVTHIISAVPFCFCSLWPHSNIPLSLQQRIHRICQSSAQSTLGGIARTRADNGKTKQFHQAAIPVRPDFWWICIPWSNFPSLQRLTISSIHTDCIKPGFDSKAGCKTQRPFENTHKIIKIKIDRGLEVKKESESHVLMQCFPW